MFILSEKYNVLLTFSPIREITGHWFEVFEYYYFLKKHGFFPCMLFNSPGIQKSTIIVALKEKYSCSISEEDIFVLEDNEHIIAAPNSVVIVCDGNFYSLERHGIKIISKKTLGFACGQKPVYSKRYEYLLDKRIYNVDYGIDYAKKIYAEILRKPERSDNNALFYLTTNCRLFDVNSLQRIIDEEFCEYDKCIIVTNNKMYSSLSGNVSVLYPPVKNLFNMFRTYVYTPVPRKFDCSPRFIAECALFGKNVEYYNIDYNDAGLEARILDIGSNKVWIKDDDEIIDIIKGFM